jgi:hypothetical protein
MATSRAAWGEQSGLLAGHRVHSGPIHDGNVADHYLGVGNAACKEVANGEPACELDNRYRSDDCPISGLRRARHGFLCMTEGSRALAA